MLPHLKRQVVLFCGTCAICQHYKRHYKQYGHLQPKLVETTPWKQVIVDLIGPYTIRTPIGTNTLCILLMIDLVTCWFEVTDV
jgi:hypothetical protein